MNFFGIFFLGRFSQEGREGGGSAGMKRREGKKMLRR